MFSIRVHGRTASGQSTPYRPGGTRTPNRRFWRPVLYQLSYGPLLFFWEATLAPVPFRSGQGRNRTADTTIFSRVLYQLSYLARKKSPVPQVWRGAGGGGRRSFDLLSTLSLHPAGGAGPGVGFKPTRFPLRTCGGRRAPDLRLHISHFSLPVRRSVAEIPNCRGLPWRHPPSASRSQCRNAANGRRSVLPASVAGAGFEPATFGL